MSFIDGEAMKLTEILVPWIAVLFSIMIAFWLKDFAQNFMVGLKFRMNSAFNEGDKVRNKDISEEKVRIIKLFSLKYWEFNKFRKLAVVTKRNKNGRGIIGIARSCWDRLNFT